MSLKKKKKRKEEEKSHVGYLLENWRFAHMPIVWCSSFGWTITPAKCLACDHDQDLFSINVNGSVRHSRHAWKSTLKEISNEEFCRPVKWNHTTVECDDNFEQRICIPSSVKIRQVWRSKQNRSKYLRMWTANQVFEILLPTDTHMHTNRHARKKKKKSFLKTKGQN